MSALSVQELFMAIFMIFPVFTLAIDRSKTFSLTGTLKIPDTSTDFNISAIFERHALRYGQNSPDNNQWDKHRANVMAISHNQGFISSFHVGSSVLRLNIDTGSSDLWVFSRYLSQPQRHGHGIYKPSVYQSEAKGQHWKIKYADGSFANGHVFYDVVGIGGIWAKSQAIEVAEGVSTNFIKNTGVDGIMGLGFSSVNRIKPEPQKTFFENVQSQLNMPIFAVSLKKDGLGTYDFGFINESKYTDSLTYVDVDTSRGRWGFNASAFAIGEARMENDLIEGIIDTGASLMFLPDAIIKSYYSNVPGAEHDSQLDSWSVGCFESLPSFSIIINGYRAIVPGDLIKLGPTSPGSSRCLGGIQGNMGTGVSIFGVIFLKSQYVVFDASVPRLGFATQS